MAIWEHVQGYTGDTIANGQLWFIRNASSYRKLRITGFARPVNDGATLLLQTGTNNNNADNSSSDYQWQSLDATDPSIPDVNTPQVGFDFADARIPIAESVGNGANYGVHFNLTVDNFNQSEHCWVMGTVSSIRTGGDPHITLMAGRRLETDARNLLCIYFSSGQIAEAHIICEGVIAS